MRVRAVVAVLALFAACTEPPDESPLGRECAAILARPEQKVEGIRVQHVLLAFVGAKRGSESGHTKAEAEKLAAEVLAKARAGDDFAALVKAHSYDEGDGIFRLTKQNRADFARWFADVAYRLAPGETGIASYHRNDSPFGWHVIKRLE